MTKNSVINVGFFAALSCVSAFALTRSDNGRIYVASIVIGSVSGFILGAVSALENL